MAMEAFLLSPSVSEMLVLRKVVVRPMTVRLRLALFTLWSWFPLMWQKCLKIPPRVLFGTLTFALDMWTEGSLLRGSIYMQMRLFLWPHSTVPLIRPSISLLSSCVPFWTMQSMFLMRSAMFTWVVPGVSSCLMLRVMVRRLTRLLGLKREVWLLVCLALLSPESTSTLSIRSERCCVLLQTWLVKFCMLLGW